MNRRNIRPSRPRGLWLAIGSAIALLAGAFQLKEVEPEFEDNSAPEKLKELLVRQRVARALDEAGP